MRRMGAAGDFQGRFLYRASRFASKKMVHLPELRALTLILGRWGVLRMVRYTIWTSRMEVSAPFPLRRAWFRNY